MRTPAVVFALLLSACVERPSTTLTGKTMGTYYDIRYSSNQRFQPEIDSILNSIVGAASTYDSISEISVFNQKGVLQFKSPHLLKMLNLARQFHKETHGAFEPTLMPFIKAYGFNTGDPHTLSKDQIDSLFSFVSFDFITFNHIRMQTTKPGIQLDLSAMGEGYAIDMISGFLDGKGIKNYKVEIGGEVKCKGSHSNGAVWTIGIENPASFGPVTLLTTTMLSDEAISTSGTSRKYYTDEQGKRRSHIIDPKTGYSVENNLLSVTVKNPMAVKADVFATALMVMGLDSAKSFTRKANIAAFIVYQEKDKVLSWSTPDFFNSQDRRIVQR